MRFALLAILAFGCGGAIDSSSDAGSDASHEPAHVHSCHDDVGSNVAPAPKFTRVIPYAHGVSLAIDRCGNVYVSGDFRDTMDAGDGPHASKGDYDAFVMKLDATGKTLWTRTFGGPKDDEAEYVAIGDEDEVIIAGQSGGGIDFGDGPLDGGQSNVGFVARLNGAGAVIASKALDGYGTKLSTFGDATYVVLYHGGNATLARYSRALDEMWSIPIETKRGGGPTTIQATQNGVRVGGTLHESLSIGTVTVQAPTSSSYVAMVGSDGTPSWVNPFGCDGPVETTTVHRLGFAHDGGFLSTGEFSGQPCDIGAGPWTGKTDPYIARHNAFGSIEWVVRFPSTQLWDVGEAVAEAPNGNLVVTGGFSGALDFGGQTLTSAGSLDAFLAELDPNGKTIWSKRFGGSDLDVGYDVKVDETGAIFTTGWFVDSADFGEGPVKVPLNGMYVLKLQP